MSSENIVYRGLSCIAIIASLATTAACKKPELYEYQFIELSNPSECSPMDINDLNEVLCGGSTNYIYREGDYIPLQSTNELSPGVLNRFNSMGIAVGYTDFLAGYPTFYDNGAVTHIDNYGQGTNYFANVNESGVAVGSIETAENRMTGFVFESGEMNIISGCQNNEDMIVSDINNSDQVLYICWEIPSQRYPTTMVLDRQTGLPHYDSGLFGQNAIGYSMNDQRVIVGVLFLQGVEKPFIYYPYAGSVTEIGGGKGEAHMINNGNQVVGNEYDNNGELFAFIYDEVHDTRDLNTLVKLPEGYHLQTATAINDAGNIIGEFTTGNGGGTKGFMLKPLK